MEIQRAEWRVRADEPRTPLGVVLGKDLARGVPVSWSVFACAFLYGLERSLLAIWLPKPWEEWIGLASGFAFFVLFAVLLDYHRPPVAAPDPSLMPSQRVNATFVLGRRTTGHDAGILTFVGGWLHFEGEHTAFSLRYPDVAGIARVDEERRLTLPEGQTVRLKPFHSDREAFARDFEAWGEGPPPDGLSRLPPRTPHARVRHGLAGSLQAFSAFIPGVFLGVMVPDLLRGAANGDAGPILVGVAAVSLVLSGLARLLAWTQRRRRA